MGEKLSKAATRLAKRPDPPKLTPAEMKLKLAADAADAAIEADVEAAEKDLEAVCKKYSGSPDKPMEESSKEPTDAEP